MDQTRKSKFVFSVFLDSYLILSYAQVFISQLKLVLTSYFLTIESADFSRPLWELFEMYTRYEIRRRQCDLKKLFTQRWLRELREIQFSAKKRDSSSSLRELLHLLL